MSISLKSALSSISLGLYIAIGCSIGTSAAKAQRTHYLLDNTCVQEGGYIRRHTEDLSIGRQIYTRLFSLDARGFNQPAIITCRVTPTANRTLQLQFGMKSSARSPFMDVRVWMDGNEVEKQRISPGQVSSVITDMSGVRSVAIEVACVRAERCGSDKVQFFRAHIQDAPTSPGAR